MNRKILPFFFTLYSLSAFAQKDLVKGFIILENNDTIQGLLKNKTYFSAGAVKIYQGDLRTKYPKKVISEIHLNSERYIKSDVDCWSEAFFKKELSGNVNLYTFKQKKKLGGFDTDINDGRLTPAINFYCSDYPHLKDTVKKIDQENVDEFLTVYNDWKLKNPSSKSFFEKNIHRIPLINLKLSFFLPGAGMELRLNEKLSFNTMVKYTLGYGSPLDFIVAPSLNTQIRYYHNMDKRKRANKRTYKYSGNYICLLDFYSIITQSNAIGIEYGWQRTIGKHWYYNIGMGAGKFTNDNQRFIFIYDYDFGYNF